MSFSEPRSKFVGKKTEKENNKVVSKVCFDLHRSFIQMTRADKRMHLNNDDEINDQCSTEAKHYHCTVPKI